MKRQPSPPEQAEPQGFGQGGIDVQSELGQVPAPVPASADVEAG